MVTVVYMPCADCRLRSEDTGRLPVPNARQTEPPPRVAQEAALLWPKGDWVLASLMLRSWNRFLECLGQIGYTGPVMAEPFSESVRKMPTEEAIRATREAVDSVWPD